MFLPANPYDLNCPSRELLDLIGGKWAILILCCLQQGPVRTGDLRRSIGGISQKMLTQTLRELEQNGFVKRVSHPEVPPRVEYSLTVIGESLSCVARGLEQWVVENYESILAHRSALSGAVDGN
ncbi:MAG: helix-turn-helix domain-containing protein [Pseudomonadota bacterium]